MKKLLLFVLFLPLFSLAQNVGIGTTTPAAKLDVKTTGSYVSQFNGAAPMYMGIYENDIYRGYWGSYSGAAEDVDFGTGSGNTMGKLHLTVQASPKLTINTLGDVGIGTVTPNHKFHLNGGDLFVQSSSGKIRLGYDGGNEWQMATTGGGADLRWYSTTDGGSTINPRHYFSQNGDVMIGGGGVPLARLHVSTTASETVRMEGLNPYLSFYDNVDGYKGYLWYNGADMVLGSSTAPIRFASSGYRMTINTDGRIYMGIGNAPATGYMLSVAGKVIAEEVKVQLKTSWPDYVFANDYKLLPIDELEKLIIKNKHLPNIPSAAEVEKNGISLGDMNKRLMEKVEELTLYIIQLKKENNTTDERLKIIEAKLNELR